MVGRAIRHYRVRRMAMVLMIVAFVIFLYAFYYTNTPFKTPVQSSGLPKTTAYIGIRDAGEIKGALSNKNGTGLQETLLPEERNNIIPSPTTEHSSSLLKSTAFIDISDVGEMGGALSSKNITGHQDAFLPVERENILSSASPTLKHSSSSSKSTAFIEISDAGGIGGALSSKNITDPQALLTVERDNISTSALPTPEHSSSLPKSTDYLGLTDAGEKGGDLSNKNITGHQETLLPVETNALLRMVIAYSSVQKSDQHGKNVTSKALTTHNASSASPFTDTSNSIRTNDLYEQGYSEANAHLCPIAGENIRLLILITSAPTHGEARLAIRQTWGHYAVRRDIAIAFVLGATQQQSVDNSLSAENDMYGDLIRGNFIDSYTNLTLKTISSLEWVDTYCPKASFILKTDDDMFINVPKLLMFIEQHHNDTNAIYGRLAVEWEPIRDNASKYYVSPQEYFAPVFPVFTTGPAYLMTSDVVRSLYVMALKQTYFKLEDVFVTGIVAELANVNRVQANDFQNDRIFYTPCNIRKTISIHEVKINEQFDLWKKLLDTDTKCEGAVHKKRPSLGGGGVVHQKVAKPDEGKGE